jgi:hypothetical protein
MSINNREDANSYYNLINNLVDDYIEKWKIRPSSLGRYLSTNSDRFNKFLMRNGLSEIKGIDRILSDVIEDRVSMEKDGVITFENFKYFESDEFKISSMKQCLYKGIEKADIKMEKIIADCFDTNLGSIDIIDADKHLFKLDDWEGEDLRVIVYSAEDLKLIKNNIIEHLYDKFSKEKMSIVDDISINLGDMIKSDVFSNTIDDKLNDDKLVDIINGLLSGFKFKLKKSDYYVWIS